MKKAVLMFLSLGICLGAIAQSPGSGTIKELSGMVELKNAGDVSFVPAKLGDSLGEDTVVSTGFKSSALIESGSVLIVVRPLTRLTLTEIRSSAGTETLNINLQAGRVRVDVNPPAGNKASMTVTSPSATASVRGTSFEIGTNGIYVYEGRVAYQGTHGNLYNVDAGSSAVTQANGTLQDPNASIRAGFRPSSPVGYDLPSVQVSSATVSVRQPSPDRPSGPSGPSGPGTPGTPGSPSTPSGPSTPSAPSGPSGTGNTDGTVGIDIFVW